MGQLALKEECYAFAGCNCWSCTGPILIRDGSMGMDRSGSFPYCEECVQYELPEEPPPRDEQDILAFNRDLGGKAPFGCGQQAVCC